MVTIYDIAKKCHCSPSTVSKVINNYSSIPLKTKNKVLQTMKEMDFIPSQTALTLSKGKSNNVGVLAYLGLSISPIRHGLFSEILEHFQKKMNEENFDLLFVSNNVGKNRGSAYENCIARNVDGVLLFGDMHAEEVQEIINSELPCVGFDYVGDKMVGVMSDNYNLSYSLTDHLIKLGHKRIVFISGDEGEITSRRLNGFIKAMEDSNISLNKNYLIRTKYLYFEDMLNKIESLLKEEKLMPTAIMCPDDITAIKLIKTLKCKGISCPEDVSITGFDGIEMSSIFMPSLTTAKQDVEVIGQTLADMLIQLIKGKKLTQRLVEVPGSLIIGESTKIKKENE